MPQRPDVPCADCGRLGWRSRTSRPPGQYRCHECRRIAAGRRAHERLRDIASPAWRPKTLTCPTCTAAFEQHRPNQRYCSSACRDRFPRRRVSGWRSRPKGSTTSRGYGNEHHKARKVAAAKHQSSDPCVRCGSPLGQMGPHLHYDHNAARDGYLGFSHAKCNIQAAGLEGSRRAHKRRSVTSQRW